MAIAANSLTLADYAQMSNSPLVAGVSWSLIEANNVLQDIHLVTNNSLVVNGARFEGNLPTVNWSPDQRRGRDDQRHTNRVPRASLRHS